VLFFMETLSRLRKPRKSVAPRLTRRVNLLIHPKCGSILEVPSAVRGSDCCYV
jgi:hypothetical protein